MKRCQVVGAMALLVAFLTPVLILPGQAQEKVRIAYPAKSLSYFPIIVGWKMGLFEQEGLNPAFLQVRADLSIAALTTGELDYNTAFSSLIRAATKGVPVRGIFALLDRPQHVLVVNPKIRSIADLKGKRIGINEFAGAQDLEADAILSKYGLSPAEVIKLAIVGEPPRLAAMEAGSIDANIMSAPYYLQAEKRGFKTLLFLSDVVEFSHAGLGTSTRKIQNSPEQIRKLLLATLKSLDYVRKQEGKTIQVMREWMGLAEDDAREGYKVGLKTWTRDGMATEARLKFDLSVIKRELKRAEDIPISQVFDGTHLQAVLKELGRGR